MSSEPNSSMTTGLYRPLTTLSYLFNYAVLGNGANPAGYHWVNFALLAVDMSAGSLSKWQEFSRLM